MKEKSRPALIKTVWRLWNHLNPKRKKQFGLLLVQMIVSSFFEVLSLGAIIPFLSVLISPEKLFSNSTISSWISWAGIKSPAGLILPVTLIFIITAVIAGGIRIFLLWSTTRLAFGTGADLGAEAFKRVLYLPYKFHLKRNSSDFISMISHKIDVTSNVLYMALLLISSIFITFNILCALFVLNPSIALGAFIGLGSLYFFISRFFRNLLFRNSQRVAKERPILTKILQEGLGGIRDILLDGTQEFFLKNFQRANSSLRDAIGDINLIGGAPRFLLESFGMAIIAVLAFRLTQHGNASSSLPILGAFALGAQRLLPVLQLGYNSWVNIVGNFTSLIDSLDFLDQPLSHEAEKPLPSPLSFKNSIRFEEVCFRYEDDEQWVLNKISFEIKKGSKVGFVGVTGSGKSTSLDLLMGLLDPNSGRILVDENPIDEKTKRALQQIIAHVPQNVYLSDATFTQNIAFGVPDEKINNLRVQKASKEACIYDLILERSEGFNSIIGERGIRLSGGQRQRIGIARALYKEASILVFDEATSSLDNSTELDVMNAINRLGADITILMIAHRLTTLRNCDKIIELKAGEIISHESYESFMENRRDFENQLIP